MRTPAILACALGVMLSGPAAADPDQPTRMGTEKEKTVYVQLIVKACRSVVTPLEPINHGKIYDNEKPMTAAERKAASADRAKKEEAADQAKKEDAAEKAGKDESADKAKADEPAAEEAKPEAPAEDSAPAELAAEESSKKASDAEGAEA